MVECPALDLDLGCEFNPHTGLQKKKNSLDCCNRISETNFLTVLGRGVQDEGAGRLVSGEASMPGLQRAAFLLCPQMAFTVCVHTPGVSSSYKDTRPVELGPYLYNLTYP